MFLRHRRSRGPAAGRRLGVGTVLVSLGLAVLTVVAARPSAATAQEDVTPASPSGGDAAAAPETGGSQPPASSPAPAAAAVVPWSQAAMALRLADDRSVQAELDRRFAEFRGTLRWPWFSWFSTYFGEVGPTSPRGHAGLDIAGVYGEPVVAPCGGRVLQAGWHDAYGNNVTLDNGNGLVTRYGHFADIAVQEGDLVARGQLLGHIGSTGYSTGPHLHFETWRDGVLVDPLSVLPSPYPGRPYPERPTWTFPYLKRWAPAQAPRATIPDSDQHPLRRTQTARLVRRLAPHGPPSCPTRRFRCLRLVKPGQPLY